MRAQRNMEKTLASAKLILMLSKKLCIEKEIDLVIVGPEEPLVKGIYDFFKNDEQLQSYNQLPALLHEGARLEGSKSFAKAFMQRHNIPTADYKEFDTDSYEEGLEYIKDHHFRLFLKPMALRPAKAFLFAIIILKQWKNMNLLFKNPNLEMPAKKWSWKNSWMVLS